jgi:hypothetical protein
MQHHFSQHTGPWGATTSTQGQAYCFADKKQTRFKQILFLPLNKMVDKTSSTHAGGSATALTYITIQTTNKI